MAELPQLTTEIEEKYRVENNALVQEVQTDPKDKLDVEIGDTKQNEFFPQVKVKRWDNEVNVSLRLAEDFSNAEITTEGDVVQMVKDDKEIHLYPTTFNSFQYWKDINKGELTEEVIKTVEVQTEPFPRLIVNGHIWGREDEGERRERADVAERAFGDVLIVGLGLGVINTYLKLNPRVKSVTIVEISDRVVQAVKKYRPSRFTDIDVEIIDFYHYEPGKKFDFIYGDIFNVLSVSSFNSWEKFLEKANTLVKPEGTVDGRIKELYNSVSAEDYDEEVYELEVILKERPESNILNFTLNTKGVEFLYQPELTEEQIVEGIERPIHVVGSYAIYHSEGKTGNFPDVSYQSGKVGHIYRPQMVDANGERVWGDLSIDVENDTLTVTIPQDFLDTATYPVHHASGTTFGYGTMGASSANAGNIILILPATTASDAGGKSLTYIAFGTRSQSTSPVAIKGNIYDTSNVPITNGQTNSLTAPYANLGFNDLGFPTSPTLAASTAYQLCVWSSVSGKFQAQPAFDTGASGIGASQSLTFGTWPNPLVPVNTTSRYSIYGIYAATYPVTGSPIITPFASSVTSMPVAMPLNIASGDLLLSFVEVRNAGTWTPPSGWTSFMSQAGGGAVGKLDGFYKIAAGTESGTTPTWTASTTTTGIFQVRRVTNWHGTTPPEAATTSGDATAADPPNLTPSWGSAANAWLAIAGHAAVAANAFSTEPTGYLGFTSNGASSGGSATALATAFIESTGTSQNPGAFGVGGSNRFWAAATVAVRPASSAPTTSVDMWGPGIAQPYPDRITVVTY